MRESTIDCLEKLKITVIRVVFILTSIVTFDMHKAYLEEKCKDLEKCKSHLKLFIMLNFYWNYLAYDLFHQLIKELTWKDKSFESIAGEMAAYKKDLKMFRKRTTLKLFCLAVPYLMISGCKTDHLCLIESLEFDHSGKIYNSCCVELSTILNLAHSCHYTKTSTLKQQ